MTAHEIHALSGAYAVDALDEVERVRFEEHLAVCAECRAEVAGLQEAAAMLSVTSEVAPPASLRDKILTDIQGVRPLPPAVARLESRRPRRWAALAAAAAVLGVVGGGVAVWQQDEQSKPAIAETTIDRVLSASDVEHVTAKLPGGAEATTFWSEREHAAVLVTRKMPDAPAGRIYQVWLQKGDDMVPAATMTKGGNNTVLLEGDPTEASGVGVTVEPEGGSAEPSSAPVALMNFDDA